MLLTVPLIKTLTSCHTFWEHIYNQSCMSDCLFTKWRSQVQPTFTALLFVWLKKSVLIHEFSTFAMNIINIVNYNVK